MAIFYTFLSSATSALSLAAIKKPGAAHSSIREKGARQTGKHQFQPDSCSKRRSGGSMSSSSSLAFAIQGYILARHNPFDKQKEFYYPICKFFSSLEKNTPLLWRTLIQRLEDKGFQYI
ncbi:hypothetical protein [Olsenella sp. Marseille-QA0557]|uniref:hypothetical protein n=1 Tax=Olsenella sp. Marseille-QA0557 TaxID=3378782 RepID=UPI003D122D75